MAEKSDGNGCATCNVPKSCSVCNPDSYTAERLDIWLAAKAAMDADWGDDYTPDPADVAWLARFLAGETEEGCN